MTEHIAPPKPIERISKRYMQLDRKYFQDHPEATEYVRPFIPGESWPVQHEPIPDLTRVTKVTSWYRLRQFLYVNASEDIRRRGVKCSIEAEGMDLPATNGRLPVWPMEPK